jgi:DNA-binding transcriptional MerR regulator
MSTDRSGRRGSVKGPVAPERAEVDIDLGSDKLYFKIGEVGEIVGVAPHVLRYWESEFKTLRPQKSRTQQRVYRRRDVITLLRIKHLLYEQKFTIAGARKQLKELADTCEVAAPSGMYRAKQSLARVRSLIAETRALMDSPGTFDRAAADPASFLARVGGVQTMLEGAETILSRPPRQPR